MPTLCLPRGYRENQVPKYCYRPVESVDWQKAQYEYAGQLCQHYAVGDVVDFGAGDGIKLNKYIPNTVAKHAIEYGTNVTICKQVIPNTVEWNLENHFRIYNSIPNLKNYGIICVDVIEHLINPIPMLQSMLYDEECKFIFITTPERELVHGIGHMGPPVNPCHVREWTLCEFQQLLRYHCHGRREPTLGLIGNAGQLNCMYAVL